MMAVISLEMGLNDLISFYVLRRLSYFPQNMPPKIAQIRLVSSHPQVYESCDDSFALSDLRDLKAHGVHAELLNTNIAAGLEKRLSGLVDVMVVNPPYVPTPEEEVGSVGITSSWAANDPLKTCLQMRDKGCASKIVVQRSTEEESLHVIKFWRDPDIRLDGNEAGSIAKIGSPRGLEFLRSQLSRLSFKRQGNSTP
ncbi:HemK methyltransferase family member 2-like protein [Tanacetum coccineum]